MDNKENIFVSVLDRHKGIIFKVANTYCSDNSDKDDLIQEIILQLWISIDRYDNKYKWSTWIYRIALNTSISFYRKNKFRKEKTIPLSPIIEISDSEEHLLDDRIVLLNRLIRELREIDKAIILLHLEGLDSQEIADIIKSTQTNVTTKVYRIKKVLKQKFDEHKNKTYGKQ